MVGLLWGSWWGVIQEGSVKRYDFL